MFREKKSKQVLDLDTEWLKQPFNAFSLMTRKRESLFTVRNVNNDFMLFNILGAHK